MKKTYDYSSRIHFSEEKDVKLYLHPHEEEILVKWVDLHPGHDAGVLLNPRINGYNPYFSVLVQFMALQRFSRQRSEENRIRRFIDLTLRAKC